MKQTPNHSYRALLARLLAVVPLLTACSREAATDLFEGRTPVRISTAFVPQETGQTRAATDLNDVQGFTVSSTAARNQLCVNINGTDYTYSVQGTAGQPSQQIKTDSQPYFPVGVNAVAVSAHYPNFTLSAGGTADFTVQTDQTSQDSYLQSDLMTAHQATATRTLADGAWQVTDADLSFQHQLTKLVIKAESEDETRIKVTGATINHVKPTVTLTRTSGQYTIGAAKGTESTVKVLNGPGTGAAVIPPQTFTGTTASPLQFVTVSVSYLSDPHDTGSSWKTADLTFSFTNAKTFLANTVYTMNIVVGIDQITLSDGVVDISGWDTSDNIIWITPTVTKSGLASLGKIELSTSLNKVYTGAAHTLTTAQSKDIAAEMKVWARADLRTDDYNIFLQQSTDDGKTGDYVVTYVNNVHADDSQETATVKVIGINNYSGFIEAKFQIHSKSINESHVTIDNVDDMVYDGGEKMPEVRIYDDETGTKQELHINTDYTLDYAADVVNCGEKSFTIKGIGNYNGTRTTVPTYNITKSPNGVCKFDVSDQTKRYYLPTGATETYTPVITQLEGDAQSDLTITMTSSNTTVATTAGNGQISIKSGGTNGAELTATITIAITGKNYTYPNQTFTLKVKSGPKLPIMYVADTDMGTATTLAENNWSTSAAFFCWNSDRMRGFDPTKIGTNAVLPTYHVPTYYEWLSIFPSTKLTYNASTTITDQADNNIQFGYKKSNGTYASASAGVSSWKSDYYSAGNGTAYGLRFKGTNYSCAYRYDWLMTDDSNMWLTGNTYGKYSLVVRVIYLGSGNKYMGTTTCSTAASLATNISENDWNTNYDFKIALPVCGSNYAGCEAGQFAHDALPLFGHRMSSTVASGNDRYSLRYDLSGITFATATYGYTYGVNLRPFKND